MTTSDLASTLRRRFHPVLLGTGNFGGIAELLLPVSAWTPQARPRSWTMQLKSESRCSTQWTFTPKVQPNELSLSGGVRTRTRMY